MILPLEQNFHYKLLLRNPLDHKYLENTRTTLKKAEIYCLKKKSPSHFVRNKRFEQHTYIYYMHAYVYNVVPSEVQMYKTSNQQIMS